MVTRTSRFRLLSGENVDSKVLKEAQRDKFYALIQTGVLNGSVEIGHRVHVSSPEDLSGQMLRMYVVYVDANASHHFTGKNMI
jgi:hypothetical protein